MKKRITIEEISKYAYNGYLPDEEMNCAERCLFYSLRDLYAAHKENRITRPMAEQEKEKLIKQFKKDQEELSYSMMFLQYQGKFWKEIEAAGTRYKTEPTIENADAFVKAVYGVGRKETSEVT